MIIYMYCRFQKKRSHIPFLIRNYNFSFRLVIKSNCKIIISYVYHLHIALILWMGFCTVNTDVHSNWGFMIVTSRFACLKVKLIYQESFLTYLKVINQMKHNKWKGYKVSDNASLHLTTTNVFFWYLARRYEYLA